MSLPITIRDGTGAGKEVVVTGRNGLCVQPIFEPAFISQKTKIFRQFLTNGGWSGDSSNMIVNGSSTNVNFWAQADPITDRDITVLNFVIADNGNFLQNEFGDLGIVLTNGCRLFYTRGQGDEIDIHDALKTNFDFTRLALGRPAFGATSTTFRGTNFVGTAEAMMPVVDFKEFMPPFGIKLEAGSSQRITLRVRDALAGLVNFDCIAYGFDRLPD